MALFPLAVAPGARYLKTASGAPFAVAMDSTWWAAFNIDTTDQATYFADRIAKGFTATLLTVIEHKGTLNKPPLDFVSNLPFTKQLGGSTYTGSPNGTTSANGNAQQYAADPYSNASVQSPDFTFPNSSYWTRLATFITQCANDNLLVFAFPCYVGFGGGDEGWMVELSANDAVVGAGGQTGQSFADPTKTKAWNYGAWLANQFASFSNIIWVDGGDYGSGGTSGTFTTAQKTAVNNLNLGMRSVVSALSQLHTAHWSRPSHASDVTLTVPFEVQSVYSDTIPASEQRAGWVAQTSPVFGIENEYDGPANTVGTAPYRKYHWWSVTSGGGYCYGNASSPTPTWLFDSGWPSQLNTQCQQDDARLNAFISSIRWWLLVPSGLTFGVVTQNTIVTANGSTSTSQDYVSASADLNGTVCVIYVPPAWSLGTFTVDMTTMNGTVRARWFDPTAATYTLISNALSSSGTHVFTPPGTNSAGDTDWVLLLDSQGPSLFFGAGTTQ